MAYSDALDIRITDTSLRDGSHAKRHQFTADDVRCIVAALDDARMPVIDRFAFSQPFSDRRASSKTTPPSGVKVVYPGDAIYSLRVTAAGVALGDMLGERPSLQQRS